MEKTYYTINEATAATANNINSFNTYTPGEATTEYRTECDYVYNLAEKIAEKRPQYKERAEYMAGRYAKKYADYLNAYYRNEASCPSVLICGAGNFPVAKKNKQNARRDTLMNDWNYLQGYKEKLRNLLTTTAPIKASDENALEMLQDKLSKRIEAQEEMKSINAYYRKHKTLEGCEDLTEEQQVKYMKAMENSWRTNPIPFESWQLSNNNAEIHRLQDRIKKLEAVKAAGTTETEHEGFQVVENTELMRLQILFDDIPSPEVRDILKSNGFKWSPKNQAWQRQLTDNAKRALNYYVLPKLA